MVTGEQIDLSMSRLWKSTLLSTSTEQTSEVYLYGPAYQVYPASHQSDRFLLAMGKSTIDISFQLSVSTVGTSPYIAAAYG